MVKACTSPRPSGLARLERRPADERLELEEELPELDGLRVLGVDAAHDSLYVRLHFVHELHRLEDAQGLARRDDVADLDERRRSRLPGAVERADHRRLDP